MIKEIEGQWWYCCPRCGKKLILLQQGAVCHGIMAQCRERRKDGNRCGWRGEVILNPGDWSKILPNLPA